MKPGSQQQQGKSPHDGNVLRGFLFSGSGMLSIHIINSKANF
jgi:hypothetical protein